MEAEILSILANVKELSRTISTSYKNRCPCHLKNTAAFELFENDLEGIDCKRLPSQILYHNLFKGPQHVGKKALIEGEAGVGKSILCSTIVEDWANEEYFQEFFIVLLLPLYLKNVASSNSLSELLNTIYNLTVGSCSSLASYLQKNRENILILADGWDEFYGSECQAGSFLYQLLFGNALPNSIVTVVITSRPQSVSLHILQLIDHFITLRGLTVETVESCIQSEFENDITKIRYLKEQLEINPLIASLCRVPLNLAVISNICQSERIKPLPNTMTEVYSKIAWKLAELSIQSSNMQENVLSLSGYCDLPEELQQSWWLLCELAFKMIENGYSTSDPTALLSSDIKKLSCFGLMKQVSESGDVSFLYPALEQYLAALHLARQPQEVQLLFIEQSKMAYATNCCQFPILFWRFFLRKYIDEVFHVNLEIIVKVIRMVSKMHQLEKHLLCHYSLEAKNELVHREVVKALHTGKGSPLCLGHSHDAHDCNAMIYVIENVEEQCSMELNFQGCNLSTNQIIRLGSAIGEKSQCICVNGLNLSGNKLSDSTAIVVFNRAAASFKQLKMLILSNCDLKTDGINALLDALISSSCQTLTYFDLSFNPLSMSCLQCLQRHMESYNTFAILDNFSLKGSLANDVSLSFLVNFSTTISSRCVNLRRLDLSANNLGEPGNLDLSKVISHLTGLRRNFDLHLNPEYMSEVDDKFIGIMEESIKSKGTIDYTIAHGVIVGPGRSGKNTLMSRLMGNGPPDPDSISSSTGVLENVVKVEVQKLCTVATAVSNFKWRGLDYDEEALELIMTTARYHSSTPVSKPVVLKFIINEEQPATQVDVAIENRSLPSKAVSKHKTKFKVHIPKFLKKLKKGKTAKSDSGSSNSEEAKKNVVVIRPDVEPVEIFKKAVKLRGMDELRAHLESSWSLYLTNTGGQIEFQEHLPLLVCGPSVFFVTFPLNHDLDEPYDVRYEYPDGRVVTYKSTATLLEELLQTLATIDALDITSSKHSDIKANTKPKIFFVGTHRDCLLVPNIEETIQEKDMLLQKYIKHTALFRQGSIQFAQYPQQLIFTVNNLAEDDSDFQKIRSAVQQTVERKQFEEFTVKCPSSWLIFSLILRARHKSAQVLSFEECFKIAQECGIADRKELSKALTFIHLRLGLVRYFNTEELNKIVVIDPQVLFDKITDLIVKTFTSDNVDPSEMEEFRVRGVFPVSVMERISNKHTTDSKLPFTWLSKVLNYLRIAALFTDKDGEIKYFFPAALCHAPESLSNQPTSLYSFPSLLVGFESGFCPRGIPGALIKFLMTNEMRSKHPWNLIPSKIFRNQVSFSIDGFGTITLRILPTHLEISLDSEVDSEIPSSEEESKVTCEMAHTQIKKGMRAVTNQCKECKYFFGLYCTLTKCEAHKHPAKIQRSGKDKPSKLTCNVTSKRGPLPEGYDIWNFQHKTRQGKF